MLENLKQQIKKAPLKPGVYLFKNKAGEILYIGKAANLRNRVSQYFKYKAAAPYLNYLLNEAEKVEYKTTDSEIEALLLESQLIKKYKPKYNIMLRDGKQYFYVGITRESFPKIFITHQPTKYQISNIKYQNDKSKFKNIGYIGPFTDGNALKSTLRLLRRVFPYCTCKQLHHNFCLNYHIGKCLGYCCLKTASLSYDREKIKLYIRNVQTIKDILNGKKDSLIKRLKKELSQLAKKQEFEKAIELKNKIEKLEKVFANAKIIREYEPFDILKYQSKKAVLIDLKNIFTLPQIPHRIEGYDISNIQGKNATGAMVAFTDGKPDKNEYRKFKIKSTRQNFASPNLSGQEKTPDDIAMLKEVLSRRLKHSEWSYPDLIFVDGGKGQLNAALKATKNKFPIIALAKGKNEIFSSTLKKPIPMKKLPQEIQNLIREIDSEAHRFAITYYRKIHRKLLIK